MIVLGVSGLFHDSAAAIVRDGELVAACQEERFSRTKHDPALPERAIASCLELAGLEPGGLDRVVFYEKPVSAFARIVKTSVQVAPRGFGQLRRAAPAWIRSKLWVGLELERLLARLGHPLGHPVVFTDHHESHAASAFLAGPFADAAVITIDGVGEWATTTVMHGTEDGLVPLRRIEFPHSLGLLYSAFTYHCGFRVNSGEYKLMGLAPYGEPTYRDRILSELLDLHEDGSFHVRTSALGYLSGLRMTNRRFERLFDGPARDPAAPITRREVDLARSIQDVTEEVVLRIARHAHDLTGSRNVCLAGGVALNAVANGRLLREGPFDGLWVQPAAGDAGGAVGAALLVAHDAGDRRPRDGHDGMGGCLLGPAPGEDEIAASVARHGARSEHLGPERRAERIAELLAGGAVVGVVDGRMEFGPRALGNRSILADPRRADIQDRVNLQVKRRESFRPFAPAVLDERAAEWFDTDRPLPYMTVVVPVAEGRRTEVPGPTTWPPEVRVREVRSEIPAVTHVDHSARVQTVDAATAPRFHAVLAAFERLTGCPVLLNTSLNLRGEPMACTPDDALRLLTSGGLDHLVLGDHLVVIDR